MSFADDLRAGRDAARAARERSRPRPAAPPVGPPVRPPTAPPLVNQPSPIRFGYYCPLNSDNVGAPLLSSTERHILMHGLNGAGKSTRFLIELLMTVSYRSLLVFDFKGELAYQTGTERERYSDVYYINPHKMHGLPSHGFNPLMLDPDDPLFFSQLTDIGTAAVDIADKDPHWTESSASLLEGFTGWEIITARREKRLPSLANVRRMACEADRYESFTDAAGKKQRRLIGGITHTTQKILREAPPSIAGLVSRFVREHGLNELSSITSTFDTQTKWVLEPMMTADLSKAGVDFANLRKRPTTVYVMLHPLEVRKNRRWTRLIIARALSALMQPGPIKTLFILDEFRATIGNLPILNDVWSLVRGFGIQLMPFVQSMEHLQTVFGDDWQSYVGQTGLVATLGPPNDKLSAEWMSDRCGTTTALKAGFNIGDGINEGDGLNNGTGTTGAGATSNQGNGKNYGRNRSGGISYQQTERRVLKPQELKDICDGHGLIWTPGMGTKSIPFYAPNYWDREAEWVARVKKNPLA
jgi:type IV secretion system protein VirD4